MTTMDNFRMPPEPSPLPSLDSGSDEESFVVLGKSLCDVDRSPPSEQQQNELPGMSIIEETKKLIRDELRALDKKIAGGTSPQSQAQIPNPMESSGSVTKMENLSPPVTKMENLSISVTKMENLSTSANENPTNPNIGEPTRTSQTPWGSMQHAAASTSYSSMDTKEQSVQLPKPPVLGRAFESTNSAISIATFTSDLSSEEVQNKISQIIEENINLKDTILRNNQSLNAQYQRIVAWQEDVQKVHQSHKDKIYEAKAIIEKLKRENDLKAVELRRMKEHLDRKDQDIAHLNKKMAAMKIKLDEKLAQTTESNLKEFDLDIAQKKIRELENDMRKMTLENLALKQQTEVMSEQSEEKVVYQKHIQELEEQTDNSKTRIEELETELAKAKYTVSERERGLTIENESLRSQLVNLTQHQADLVRPEELCNLKQQLQVTQMNLVQAEQTRAQAYQTIQMLNRQVEALNLQKQSEGSVRQDDEIYALQTQLELYKADFEAERTAKENIREEKEKILEDLQNLQRRNQQLQEEIDLMRVRPVGETYPRQRPPSTTTTTTPSAPNDHPFQCPKCNFGFRDLQSLQNHVYRCIDIDESLP